MFNSSHLDILVDTLLPAGQLLQRTLNVAEFIYSSKKKKPKRTQYNTVTKQIHMGVQGEKGWSPTMARESGQVSRMGLRSKKKIQGLHAHAKAVTEMGD